MRLSVSVLRLPDASVIKDFIILVCSQVAKGMVLWQLLGTYVLLCFSPLSPTSPAICNSADDLNELDRWLSSKEGSSKAQEVSEGCHQRR